MSDPCLAVINHGPGHQSTTRCGETGKHHQHRAVLSPRVFEWCDCHAVEVDWSDTAQVFTGFFDENPDFADCELEGVSE